MPRIEQWVYLDESGSTGLKDLHGPQQVFALGAVIFDDLQDIETTIARMRDLRHRLGKPATFQFHCADASPRLRREFAGEMCDCPFRVRALIVPKADIAPGSPLTSPSSLYRVALKTLLQCEEAVCNAKVFLDRRGGHRTRIELMTYLRKHLNAPDHPVIVDFRFAPKSSDLIQLVDMVIGVIARAHCGVAGAVECQTLLRSRIESIAILGQE